MIDTIQYIGMPSETVVNIFKNAGYQVIVSQQKVPQLLTCNFVPNRVTLEICNGNVTNITIG